MHDEKHFTSSATIRDLIIGMADGLTVPFALTAGLSSIISSNAIIISAGVAEIVAGSIAMGLGGYLSAKTELEHYDSELKREYEEVEKFPEIEKQEVMGFLAEYGISKKLQEEVALELSHDKDNWVEFMMRFELGMEKPHPKRAFKSAFNIGIAYIIGGFVPLLGYIFSDNAQQGLIYSSVLTIIFLLVFGYTKTLLTGQNPILGALKTALIGVLAAAAAYSIARLIS